MSHHLPLHKAFISVTFTKTQQTQPKASLKQEPQTSNPSKEEKRHQNPTQVWHQGSTDTLKPYTTKMQGRKIWKLQNCKTSLLLEEQMNNCILLLNSGKVKLTTFTNCRRKHSCYVYSLFWIKTQVYDFQFHKLKIDPPTDKFTLRASSNISWLSVTILPWATIPFYSVIPFCFIISSCFNSSEENLQQVKTSIFL